MRHTRSTAILAALTLTGLLAAGAFGWYGKGHVAATDNALAMLPTSMPAFFLAGGSAIGQSAEDPDIFRIAPPELRDAEGPEHFIDLELLKDAKLPATRSGYIALCAKAELEPGKVGYVPYAVAEWTGRLTVALAQHRRYPQDKAIQAKCLVIAGTLAHYAQDLEMPLHTTVHYDGRVRDDGSSPRSGIHARVDALLEKVPAPAAASAPTGADPSSRPTSQPAPVAFDQVFPAILDELARSHALVDKVYDLEKDLPAENQPLPADGPARAFAAERLTAAARFTASLFLTAWVKSETYKLPDWYAPTTAPSK